MNAKTSRLAAAALLAAATLGTGAARADAVTDWNAIMQATVTASGGTPATNPNHQTRWGAIVQLAVGYVKDLVGGADDGGGGLRLGLAASGQVGAELGLVAGLAIGEADEPNHGPQRTPPGGGAAGLEHLDRRQRCQRMRRCHHGVAGVHGGPPGKMEISHAMITRFGRHAAARRGFTWHIHPTMSNGPAA